MSKWYRQTENTDGSVTMAVVAPFGETEIEVRFPCHICETMVNSSDSIEVIEPFYGADTNADSERASDTDICSCDKCNKDFEIDVVNSFGGMYIQVGGVKDGNIEYKIIKEDREPGGGD